MGHGLAKLRRLLALIAVVIAAQAPPIAVATQAPPITYAGSSCRLPGQWSVAAAFDLAASGLLPPSYPQLPGGTGVQTVPPTILKAVGWVESNWHQFTSQGLPLVSFDFGYGIMQITSGMAGAFGNVRGEIDPQVQSRIASDYEYNIAYGAQVLAAKWATVPQIGDGKPAEVENWYYALWAYNGWGWVNNPNNPRFSRSGTPAINAVGFPYQERVLYLVAHPPRDANGSPLWPAVKVTLPSRKQIGEHPGPLPLTTTHRQDPPALSAVYHPSKLGTLSPGGQQAVAVRVFNTGTQAWPATGTSAVTLAYHLFTQEGDPWLPISPFSSGIVAFGQGVVPLPHNVVPGHSVTLHAVVTAPADPGTYQLAWDLDQGSGVWFSQVGVLPGVQQLDVLPPGVTPTPPPLPIPTVVAAPAESLQYVADTSIPDGTSLRVREPFVKGWLVFNDGRRDWQPGWMLHLVSGRAFGAKRIAVPPTTSCQIANIVASMRAPRRPAGYQSVWRMQDAAGQPFGQRLTLVVDVQRHAPVPTPTPTAAVPATPQPTGTYVRPTPTPVG